MPIPLPNLDDRTFADLVEETRALIPRYAPAWTNHNLSDPGITLIELFAWLTEALIYRLNRIPEASEARFLELLGASFAPAQPATVVVTVTATGLTEPLILPRSALTAEPEGGTTLGFETVHELRLTPEQPTGKVEAHQAQLVQDERLGISNGRPHQVFPVARPFVVLNPLDPSPAIPQVTVDGVQWTFSFTLLDSTAEDRHFTIDARLSAIRFGDGRLGQIPAKGAEIRCTYRSTAGAKGNFSDKTVFKLQAELPVALTILSEAGASGGADPTGLDEARAQAIGALKTRWRAVTTENFEDLVIGNSFGLARARCLPERDLTAADGTTPSPGHVSIVVVPSSGEDKPMPSSELITRVWAFLDERRLLTCRHHVVGPSYTEVRVKAAVVRTAQAKPEELQAQIRNNLQAFLHPLTGGPEPEKKGWPFGRHVYASEVDQVIEATPGVDHVASLTLWTREEGGDWTRTGDDVALAPHSLVHFDAQASEIRVRAGR